MIQHSSRWEIVMDNNKPVEVNGAVFIIDDIKKNICKFNKTFQELCCVLGQW